MNMFQLFSGYKSSFKMFSLCCIASLTFVLCMPPEHAYNSRNYYFNVTSDKELAINTLKLLSNHENDLSYLGLASVIRDDVIPQAQPNTGNIQPLHTTFMDSIKLSPKLGDIMRIENLKGQQNHRLKIIAKCMNNSYGIVMKKPKIKHRNRYEIRLEWIQNRDVKASIKLKYLRLIPNIYFHLISDEYKDDWQYISSLCRGILAKNRRLVINQVMDISMMSHPNIMSESLIFPLILSYDLVHIIDLKEATQITAFLMQMPYHLSPRLFQQVMDKLYSSKVAKIKSVRTKMLPKLKALYTDLYNMHYHAFNNISDLNQTDYPLYLLQNESESATVRYLTTNYVTTPKDYGRFWESVMGSIMYVLQCELRRRMTQQDSLNAIDTFLKGEKHVLFMYDVVSSYKTSLMSAPRKDLHVISFEATDWNYEKLMKDISEVLSPHHTFPSLIAQTIIKRVSHNPEVYVV